MAKTEMHEFSQKDLTDLQQLWKGAIVEKTADQQTKALLGRLNIRIDISKLFSAAWTAAKICLTAVRVKKGDVDPATAMSLAEDSYSLCLASLDAIRERMGELEYCACLALSDASKPISESEFRSTLEEFLKSASKKKFPWYLGMSEKLLGKAQRDLQLPSGFQDLMKLLKTRDWLVYDGERIRFKPRHWTWKSSVK